MPTCGIMESSLIHFHLVSYICKSHLYSMCENTGLHELGALATLMLTSAGKHAHNNNAPAKQHAIAWQVNLSCWLSLFLVII